MNVHEARVSCRVICFPSCVCSYMSFLQMLLVFPVGSTRLVSGFDVYSRQRHALGWLMASRVAVLYLCGSTCLPMSRL